MENFPPSSKKAQERAQAPKRVGRVTSAEAQRRKKPLGKRIKELIFSTDGRTAADYAISEVVLPMIKELVHESVSAAWDRLLYGDTRRRPSRGPVSGPTGYVTYNRMSMRQDDRPPMPSSISRRARARHDFDDIVLTSRSEAEEVIDRLFDLISRYEMASVADLYELTGIQSAHTDQKWGWTDLRGANVQKLRTGGYLLNLPEPDSLD